MNVSILGQPGFAPALARVLLRHVPQGGRVLDIATGTGDVAFFSGRSGTSVVGIDSRTECSRWPKKRQGRARALDEWFSRPASFSDRSFECGVAFRYAICADVWKAFKENSVCFAMAQVLHMDLDGDIGIFPLGHRVHLSLGCLDRALGLRGPLAERVSGNTIRELWPRQVTTSS